MNSYCKNLLGSQNALQLSSCKNFGNYSDNDRSGRSWMSHGPYTSEISYEDLQDKNEVCDIVKQQTYRYIDLHSNVYDERSSGSMFAYESDGMDRKRKHRRVLNFLGVLLLVTAVGGLGFLALRS